MEQKSTLKQSLVDLARSSEIDVLVTRKKNLEQQVQDLQRHINQQDERANALEKQQHLQAQREAELNAMRGHEASQRQQIEMHLRALEVESSRRQQELIKREEDFQRQLMQREALFSEREKTLADRQQKLLERQAESEAIRASLEVELSQRQLKLDQALAELEQEKERYNEESRKRLEQTSQDYVADVLMVLEKKEGQFHTFAKRWSVGGAAALGIGVIYFFVTTFLVTQSLTEAASWQFITYSFFKGFVAIALLVGFSRYAFLFSNAYMREALKNADRTHAINFGKFYLQSYGAAADWAQVKEAFANWNISSQSAFAANERINSDLSTVESAASLVERVAKALPKIKASEGS